MLPFSLQGQTGARTILLFHQWKQIVAQNSTNKPLTTRKKRERMSHNENLGTENEYLLLSLYPCRSINRCILLWFLYIIGVVC